MNITIEDGCTKLIAVALPPDHPVEYGARKVAPPVNNADATPAVAIGTAVGILALVSVYVSTPPVDPTVLLITAVPLPPTPIKAFLFKLGRLNVVDPSPLPQVVPIAANNKGLPVLLTAVPSHDKNPVGADVPP